MSIQYKHAAPGREFRPTPKGRDEYFMDARFEKKPEYKQRIPKHWISKGWVKECRTSIIV